MAELRINISEIVDRVVEQLKSNGLMIVKHGKWEHGRCTECSKSLEDLFSGEFYYDQEEVKFCPNCGTKMDGDVMKDKAHWTNTVETVWNAKDKYGKQELEISIVTAKCSICGKWAEQVNTFPQYMLYKYCPHCGARMEVDEDGTRD